MFSSSDWNNSSEQCHDLPKRTYEIIETDFYGFRNGLQWVLKRTGTDYSSDRNELQWEPEKVGWGTIGTILLKLCMYW